MENNRRITLADLDRLDDGSFDRMVEKIRETASDEKEIERLTTLNVLQKFSRRLLMDRMEESSSSSNITPRRESDGSESEGSNELVPGNKLGLEVKDFEQSLEKSDHDIREAKEKDSANSAEKKVVKKIKIVIIKNDNDKKNKYAELGLEPPPNLPASLRELVEKKGGRDITLVMMKELERMDDYYLTIRALQLKEPSFLTEREKWILDRHDAVMEVTMIQPCHEEITLGLKKLPMISSCCYVLTGEWSSVIRNENNGLGEMDVVQLWSFRYDNKNFLGFVLVKVWPSNGESTDTSA